MAYKDKEKQRAAWRKSYYLHKEKHRTHRKVARAKRRDLIAKLKGQPCQDCGQRFPPECMDFDHVRDKKVAGIAGMKERPLDLVLTEIAKCEVVCSNCHRIRTKRRVLSLKVKRGVVAP